MKDNMTSISLRFNTPKAWVDTVLADFDQFLLDHAAAEKKASGMAVSMLSHYPDKKNLVIAMADLAIEEMSHYREVVKLIHQRGHITGKDEKDPYVIEFRKHLRNGKEEYFLDRLLVGGIIEARGAERFGLIAEAVEDQQLKQFYQSITRSEERHNDLMVELALEYFNQEEVESRLDELLAIEANICEALPIRACLH